MKRRSFLKGAIAAPAALTVPDLLAGLIQFRGDDPPQGVPPKTEHTARLYIDGMPIDDVLSIEMCGRQDVISVTALDSPMQYFEPLDYCDFTAAVYTCPSLVEPLSKICEEARAVDFSIVIGPAVNSFVGYIRELRFVAPAHEPLIVHIEARAASPVTVTEAS